jgi:ketosteroid isomerase-like protein
LLIPDARSIIVFAGFSAHQRAPKEMNSMNGRLAVGLIVAAYIALPAAAFASDEEAQIRALEDRFVAAVNAGDIDAIMKAYVPDDSLLVFDVVPPRQYVGSDGYRKGWANFFGMLSGPPKFDVKDLSIVAEGNLGFSHSIQHAIGTDKQGHPVDLTVRVSDDYRKVGGNWLIVHEHVSVPVDLATGKPDLSSRP